MCDELIFLQFKTRSIIKEDNRYIVAYSWGDLDNTTDPAVWENVVCYSLDGKRLWKINGMEEYPYWDKNMDTFVGLNKYDGSIKAVSFSGNSYIVDIETGKATFYQFHK